MQNKYLRFALFFLVFLTVFQFFGKKEPTAVSQEEIVLSAKSSFSVGKEVQIQVKNNRPDALAIPLPCPANPLKVERYKDGEWAEIQASIDPTECQAKTLTVDPGKAQLVKFGLWNYKLFNDPGRYRASLITKTAEGKEKGYTQEFEISPPWAITLLGTNLFYRPIFNTLIYLISIIPNHDLGWGIILLTLLIKILLLGPNQKALKSQRAMQRLQPELDALKLRHKNDQQKLAQETMALWKKHKVSPMGSCLPMLIQFPILIALFYVVRDGLSVLDPELFYAPLKAFDLKSMNVNFLGLLDLTKVNTLVLPVLVGGLQFLQMHLTFGKAKAAAPATTSDPMSSMSKTMKYIMPVMIGVFTASVPAAVGFYWGTSTLFGIGQQVAVNRMKD